MPGRWDILWAPRGCVPVRNVVVDNLALRLPAYISKSTCQWTLSLSLHIFETDCLPIPSLKINGYVKLNIRQTRGVQAIWILRNSQSLPHSSSHSWNKLFTNLFWETHNHSLIIHHILDRLFTNSLAQNNWVATTETQFFETISSQFEHTTHAFQTCGQSEIWHILKSDWLPIPSPKMNGWPPLRHNVWKQISSKLNIGQTRMKCRKFEIWETHDHRYVLPGQARLTVAPLHRSHRHSHGCACSVPLTKLQPTQNPSPALVQFKTGEDPYPYPEQKLQNSSATHMQFKLRSSPYPSLLKLLKFLPPLLGAPSWYLRIQGLGS